MGIAYCGIRFFFQNVLKREWHVFTYMNAKREKRLPCVLSKEEVFDILSSVTTFHNYAFLSTVYSCGFRLSEGLGLQVSDIDSKRMMIHVHRGKGAKDRFVPLPKSTLDLLRRYWLTHKNPKLIFPAMGREGNKAPTSEKPMSIDGVQGAFRRAKFAAGIKKRRVSIHTLRHSYATHFKALMECRTSACGMVVYECSKCGVQHTTFKSCGNRHCPKCQNYKVKLWVKGQMERQLPGHYFMITFTVPEQLRRFIRSNQRVAYTAMFTASSQTLKKLTPDPKFIGG
ncbi:hypothetical protein JCM12294_48030 [Desulfocicer niacini]